VVLCSRPVLVSQPLRHPQRRHTHAPAGHGTRGVAVLSLARTACQHSGVIARTSGVGPAVGTAHLASVVNATQRVALMVYVPGALDAVEPRRIIWLVHRKTYFADDIQRVNCTIFPCQRFSY